jgi:hypothetical protein
MDMSDYAKFHLLLFQRHWGGKTSHSLSTYLAEDASETHRILKAQGKKKNPA